MDQLQQLLKIYSKYPCRTLPNAFWKTAAHLAESRLVVTREDGENPASIAIWQGERLITFWCEFPDLHPLKQADIDAISFALVHEEALEVFSHRNFAVQRSYFRLAHTGIVDETRLKPGFTFEPFNPKEDIHAVVNLICASYEKINVNPEIVNAWMRHPVYDPGLWLWVVDLETGEKAGLGIAERDPRVPEASLEWIQVLPAFWGKGLGTAIVTELLRRVSGSVKFTTVSGELENVHQPERLYRRSGFTGEDVWWLLSEEG